MNPAPGAKPERPSDEAAALATWLDAAGQSEGAARARALASHLEDWEAHLVSRATEALAVHHDIRNALTGVLGNAQLVLMGPGAEVPGVKRRLESLVHEAERIKDITDRLHQARAGLLASGNGSGEAGGQAA
ncbi:MAG TPA: histidine kinase dimerization/phospho-acceptor domain-containing protein [Candidatus Eisenbacteria bacterium]|jgi:signal transduction histidine kinase|nr:histidine kinase dimerization/phospho-acceptor domain-containing protein [Candidatus Eisenbacteria bacterium]